VGEAGDIGETGVGIEYDRITISLKVITKTITRPINPSPRVMFFTHPIKGKYQDFL
jgi:hypothetical protein